MSLGDFEALVQQDIKQVIRKQNINFARPVRQ